MTGRMWILVGIVVGVALGIAGFPYLAGAAGSLADTAQRVVSTIGLTLVHRAAAAGAPRRAVQGAAALLTVLVPGATALLLIVAARGTLRVRSIVGLLLLALGVGAFFYLSAGPALGVVLLAISVGAVAVAATGPLVAAPLAALAALIATSYLPRLLTGRVPPGNPVRSMHLALFASPGSPLWLQILLLAVAAVPFAVAARLALE
ncbi:MAG: hypothetical protein M0013_13720 [Actinomycetota bacterium]|nr:hypothetical protein [Actinomycetota bacterium]